MPWGRVDDTYYDHPKLDRLTDSSEWPDRLAAAGLNSLAWSWCNRFLTDGHVPSATVRKLVGDQADGLILAEQLIAVGLWEEADGGYQIHDFLVYNDSRAQVLKRRQDEAKRKAEWRAKRGSGPSGTDTGTARPGRSPARTSRSGRTAVPPSVPAGHDVPAGQASEPTAQNVPLSVPRDSRARDVARIPSRPVPSRPTRDRVANVNGVGAHDGGEPVVGPTLTKSQLDAWSTFGSEWDAFKAAWLGRGLLHPPSGEPDDDTGQRGLLYPILDARPTTLPGWVREAKGKTAHQVIGHVLERWHAIQADAGVDEERGADGDLGKVESAQRLGSILGDLGGFTS